MFYIQISAFSTFYIVHHGPTNARGNDALTPRKIAPPHCVSESGFRSTTISTVNHNAGTVWLWNDCLGIRSHPLEYSLSKFRSGVVEDRLVMCRAWPTFNVVQYFKIGCSDGLNVQRKPNFSVAMILRGTVGWLYFNLCTVDGTNGARKLCNSKETFAGLMHFEIGFWHFNYLPSESSEKKKSWSSHESMRWKILFAFLTAIFFSIIFLAVVVFPQDKLEKVHNLNSNIELQET